MNGIVIRGTPEFVIFLDNDYVFVTIFPFAQTCQFFLLLKHDTWVFHEEERMNTPPKKLIKRSEQTTYILLSRLDKSYQYF